MLACTHSQMESISVVIPTFNGGKTLPETLACVLAQSRPPDEVIVVDDGSTEPEARRCLATLGGPKVRVIHQSNSGPGGARNSGVRAATGELLVMLDDDDLMTHDALEKLEQALQRHPEAKFSLCGLETFGGRVQRVVVPAFNPYLELDDNHYVCFGMIRREVFEAGASYPRSGYEDWSFWLACIERGFSGVVLDDTLFRYRIKERGQLSNDNKLRHAHVSEVRRRAPELFTLEGRLNLKRAFAPSLEIHCETEDDAARLRKALDSQTMGDWVVRPRGPGGTRAFVRALRSKLVLYVPSEAIPLFGRAHPSTLEQISRLMDCHLEVEALRVPVDREALGRMAAQERVQLTHRDRPAHTDLLVVRTLTAALAHQSEGEPIRTFLEACYRGARKHAVFGEDFFKLVDEPLHSSKSTPRAPIWRVVRKQMVASFGEDRTAAILHPIKEQLRAARGAARVTRAWLSVLRSPKDDEPRPVTGTRLLPPSRMEELRLIAFRPTIYHRPRTPVLPAGGRRVLMVQPWLVTGGVDRASIDMASVLSKAGYATTFVTAFPSKQDWAHKMSPLTEDIIHLGPIVEPLEQVAFVCDLIQRRSIDALFMVNSWLGLKAAAAVKRRLPGVKTVDYIHTDFRARGGDFAWQAATRYDRFLDRHWVSTRHLIKRCTEYGAAEEKFRLIRTACDEITVYNPDRVEPGWVHAHLHLPPEAMLVAMVARLHPDKNPLFVARVFESIRSGWSRLDRPLHFVFLGEGQEKPALQQQLRASGMARWTHFLPANTPMPLAMRSFSLVMLASIIEGLPLSFIEAMAMGVPVVSTGLEGIPELVDGEVGACISNHRSAARRLRELSDAALDILDDDQKRSAMSSRGRERVRKHFGIEQMRADYLAAFDDLLKSTAPMAHSKHG